MANERWDPFREVISLRDAMGSLLQESFVRPGGAGGAGGGPARLPLDISEDENELVVRATLPGVRPEDVHITVHGDTLVIRAESRPEEEKQGQHWHLRERQFGAVQRAVTLTAPIDSNRAQAGFENGVLTLILPKAEQAKPRRIPIGGANPGGPASGTKGGDGTQPSGGQGTADTPSGGGA